MQNRTLAHYTITAPLGRGGMGEVYRATDTKLGREVALKILPKEFSDDPERRARFEREARALATLQHPNVASVYGFEEAEGVRFLVMELAQGETLSEHIARGLTIDESIAIASQIALGLEAAHDKGIVHRDLKPANVQISPDGTVKLLDFGLARAWDIDGDDADPLNSPTITSANMTAHGIIMGTAAYMSPEQARGRHVDRQADVWAFGCVLYEMLTGRIAFHGDTITDTLAAIIHKEPDWTALPAATPDHLRRLLELCLRKSPPERLRDVRDIRLLMATPAGAAVQAGLDAAASGGPGITATTGKPTRRGLSWAIAAPVAIVLFLAGMALARWLLPAPAPLGANDPVRFGITFPGTMTWSSNYNRVLALSPDGTRIVLNLDSQLRLRTLDNTGLVPIPGTENARTPFVSPDSRELCFWVDGQIKRTRFAGGVPVTVAPFNERPYGASWADDGNLYIGRGTQGIWRIPADGGTPEQVVTLEPGEYAHGPVLLPGGEALLFSVSRGVQNWRSGSIEAQVLATGQRRTLIERGREARYLATGNQAAGDQATGHLAYVQDTHLTIVPFDAAQLRVLGNPVSTDIQVGTSLTDETGAANFDVARNGTLIVQPPWQSGVYKLVWQMASDDFETLPIEPKPFVVARVSPDNRHVAAQVTEAEGSTIWVYDAERGSGQRLTTTGENRGPVWSHDGVYVYFASDRNGTFDIWRRRADRGGPEELFFESDGDQMPGATSPDGRWLLFTDEMPSNRNIRRVSIGEGGAGEPVIEALLETPADELNPRSSPDGRYFLFQTNESPNWDIQVKDTVTGGRWMVSGETGGFNPRWSRDGSRIFYSNADELMEVDVRLTPEFSLTKPQPLMKLPGDANSDFDIDRDATRALLLRPYNPEGKEEIERATLSVVLNWFTEIAPRSVAAP